MSQSVRKKAAFRIWEFRESQNNENSSIFWQKWENTFPDIKKKYTKKTENEKKIVEYPNDWFSYSSSTFPTLTTFLFYIHNKY